jgi:hypothetical protein
MGALGISSGRLARILVLAGGLAYIALPLHRARRADLPPRRWWLVPLVVAVKDLAQIAGAAAGLIDATRGRPQPPPPRPRGGC